MAAHKFHGIKLANNSVIENLHLEEVAIDPVVTKGSRFWYNTSERVVKYTTLDAQGVIQVHVLPAGVDLTAIQALITAETNARTIAISDEATARATVITTEATTRAAADTALANELNAVEASIGLDSAGAYTAPSNTNYLGAATSLKAADAALDGAIKSLSDHVTTVSTSLAGNIGTVHDEVTAEASARSAADVAINQKIDALVLAGGDGSVALKNAINARLFTLKTATPETVHVIQHNLNTEFYNVTVLVQGIDGKYHNDILPLDEIDTNSFTLTLDEAANIKVSVQSLAPIV